YYGFGERYDRLNHKGTVKKTSVYNPYLNQTEETYIPIPFFIAENGYGLYVMNSMSGTLNTPLAKGIV
ncbi:MAG: hypothetical protein GX073_01440, partial [Firmicutes bacterium]|nr:hypothetical protein [Bacillota bacterium]